MQRSPDKITIWLYGYGHMGKLHASKLHNRPDVDLTIIDPVQGLLAPTTSRPDAAIICTPTHTHVELAEPLLAKGIPCLVEKPLTLRPADAWRLAQSPLLCTGHIERFSPVWPHLQDLSPKFIQCERLAPFSGRSRDIDVILDLMIHDIDLCLALMQEMPHDIRAVGIEVVSQHCDIVNARLEFPAGVAQLTASRVSAKHLRQMRLFQTNRYDSADFYQHQLHRTQWSFGTMQKTTIPIIPSDALENEQQAFLNFVRHRTPFPCSGLDGAQAVELASRIEAAR